jgi:ABC-type branched-subunit amino acid transport system ATPase component/ABC-type branched-subunit amino acid transport system permease subunit
MFAAFRVEPQIVFDGVVLGMTYGILAVGLVLVYRSTRVINFAHGQLGVFCAAVVALFVARYEINYYVSVVAALVIGAALGAAIELVVVRRLFNAPRVILFVATLGVTQMLLLFQFLLPRIGDDAQPFPRAFQLELGETPPEVFGIFLRPEHITVLIVVPALTALLALFLQRTRFGTAIRAAADNPDAARTSTINIKKMSTAVWIMAGVLAAITAVLAAPLKGASVEATSTLGPSFILRALAAALIGRMRSMPLAVLGGIGIGVMEKLLFFNNPAEPGILDAVLFVIVLITVLAISRSVRAEEGGRSMSFAPRARPIPAALERFWAVRHLPVIGFGAALFVGALLPFVFTRPSTQLTFSLMMIYAIVALSLTLLTGWAGQLSLGQFAFVGLAAVLTATLVRGMTFDLFGSTVDLGSLPFEAAVLVAAVVVTLIAIVVGVPALRVRGLFLAVTTLAFAVMTSYWLLRRPFLLGNDFALVELPDWLRSRRTYYFVCLVALLVVAMVLGQIRRSGIGRSLVAVRDNDLGASAFTISPARMKLMAFGVAGALAGIAGGLFAGYQVQFGTNAFPPEESLRVVAIAVIGGLSSITGAILGALWVIGLPVILGETDEVVFLTSGAGLLIILLYFPRGLAQLFTNLRDMALDALARRVPSAPPAKPVDIAIPSRVVDETDRVPVPATVPAIAAHGVTVRFGQRVVVEQVDLELRQGEVVGLIGTNGAGKTTLMNAIGGFVPSTGRIEILGTEVTGMSAPKRASLGLGRTFQSADLFPDLTVRETVMVSLEARRRATLPSTMLSLPKARTMERRKRSEADELIAFFGLGRYQDHCIDELSTGTRRIVELACLIGLEARVLCLDEPTAGVAQRETEAFAPLVLRIREELGASVLIVEHDMPFIMGISDRVYCLEAGAIIAEGVPHEVRNDEAVIASYLGTDERAIARSDAPV